MVTSEKRHIDIPIWFAAILLPAILAVAGDSWRTLQAVRRDLDCLKTALAVKGIIDPKVVTTGSQTANLPCFYGDPKN